MLTSTQRKFWRMFCSFICILVSNWDELRRSLPGDLMQNKSKDIPRVYPQLALKHQSALGIYKINSNRLVIYDGVLWCHSGPCKGITETYLLLLKIKYPLANFWQATYKTIPSAGRSKFQGTVFIPGLKKAGYMMEKLT